MTNKTFHTTMIIITVVVISVVGLSIACTQDNTPTPSIPHAFVSLHGEIPENWASWMFWVVRHKSGVCFVVLDQPSEGNTFLVVDDKVCKYHEGIEK